MVRFKTRVRERHFHFDEDLFNNCPDWLSLHGFYQSEKYFLNVRDELLKDFSFIDDIENPCTEMMEGLNKPIALHVRRTDYARYGHHPIVGLDYYEKALSYFDKDREVVVLSDDPTWCMEQSLFADDRFMISESRNQYIDLCLMTKCSDFIIANSSFSWWGAWLNIVRKTSNSTNEVVRSLIGCTTQYQRSLLRRLDETMTNVAVIFIGTNKYLDFLPKYYDGCEEHFMPDANKQYFVFTDGNLEGNIPDNIFIL